MRLLVPKEKNLHWIKAGCVFFKELNSARKIVFNCILDLVSYMWEKIDNFDASAKNKT
jgi:hypothetical protein